MASYAGDAQTPGGFRSAYEAEGEFADAVMNEGTNREEYADADEEMGSDADEDGQQQDVNSRTVNRATAVADSAEDTAFPLKDIGNQATWTLSTWKPGFGVAALLSESVDLYWQSDAPQPHHVDIHFAKRVEIAKIKLYLDYKRDESYTPSKIAVYAGSGYHDLHEVMSLALEEPVGWTEISLAHAGKE